MISRRRILDAYPPPGGMGRRRCPRRNDLRCSDRGRNKGMHFGFDPRRHRDGAPALPGLVLGRLHPGRILFRVARQRRNGRWKRFLAARIPAVRQARANYSSNQRRVARPIRFSFRAGSEQLPDAALFLRASVVDMANASDMATGLATTMFFNAAAQQIIQELDGGHPLIIGAVGHAVVLTAASYVAGQQLCPIDGTDRARSWPDSANRRI